MIPEHRAACRSVPAREHPSCSCLPGTALLDAVFKSSACSDSRLPYVLPGGSWQSSLRLDIGDRSTAPLLCHLRVSHVWVSWFLCRGREGEPVQPHALAASDAGRVGTIPYVLPALAAAGGRCRQLPRRERIVLRSCAGTRSPLQRSTRSSRAAAGQED